MARPLNKLADLGAGAERATRSRIGSAYSQGNAIDVRNARDLYKRRLMIGRHAAFSDEHGTPAQRLLNLLCIA